MRLIDFTVYYTMAYYKKNKIESFIWESQLKRSIYLVALNSAFWFLTLAEILFYTVGKKNFVEISYSKMIVIIVGILMIPVFQHIYITKQRYLKIISENYERPFKLNLNLGMALSFLVFFLSFLCPLVLALLIDACLNP